MSVGLVLTVSPCQHVSSFSQRPLPPLVYFFDHEEKKGKLFIDYDTGLRCKTSVDVTSQIMTLKTKKQSKDNTKDNNLIGVNLTHDPPARELAF